MQWLYSLFLSRNSTGAPEIIDTNNYYPFGLNHISGAFSTPGFGSFYSNKYNGKELQETGMYDYGARMYMPDLGRWGTTDPLAEAFRRFSPYHYGADNPVMFTDPDGMRSVPYDGGIISNVPEGSFWFAGMNGSFISTPEFKQGSRTGGSSTQGTFGQTQAYTDLIAAVQNGGDFSLKTNNGYMSWWTGGALGDANTAQEMIAHMMKLVENATTDWYATGGRGNWFFGAAATFSGIKGGFNAERMYGEGIRRGLSGNYTLTGRNLSLFGKMNPAKASMPVSSLAKWGGIAGKASFGVGVVMDVIGVYNYYNNTDSINKVHPAKAGLNTTIGAYGLTGAGTIPALLYFGVDAFYPGGWEGYGNDYQSIQSDNAAIMPGFITAPYGSQKF